MTQETFFKAVADSTRLDIVKLLLTGRKNATQVVRYAKKSQPNTSIALKHLVWAGIILKEKKGREIYYTIKEPEKMRRILELAEEVVR